MRSFESIAINPAFMSTAYIPAGHGSNSFGIEDEAGVGDDGAGVAREMVCDDSPVWVGAGVKAGVKSVKSR